MIYPSTFWLKKDCIFHQKTQKNNILVIWYFILRKISSYFFCFLFFILFYFILFIYLFIENWNIIIILLFLKILCKFCKYYKKVIFLPTTYVEKDLFLLLNIHNINFSFIQKLVESSFLLNINFPFVQISCFYNNFFHVSFNHFKRPKATLITRENVKLN